MATKVRFTDDAIERMKLVFGSVAQILPAYSKLHASLKRATSANPDDGITPAKMKQLIAEINRQQHMVGSELLAFAYDLKKDIRKAGGDAIAALPSSPDALDSDNSEEATDEQGHAVEGLAENRVTSFTADVTSSARRPRAKAVTFAAIPLLLGSLAIGAWRYLDPESQQPSSDDTKATDSSPGEPALRVTRSDLPQLSSSVFYGAAAGGEYECARVIPDRATLRSETAFPEELAATVYTFDMLANTAGVVRDEWAPVIDAGLRRGVDYRLILSDYRESNPLFGAFATSVGEADVTSARASVFEHHRQIDALLKKLEEDAKRGSDRVYRGTFGVKWNREMLLYTMWLRDSNQPDGLCHFGAHLYTGKNVWPNLRIDRKTGPKTYENLRLEFEFAWKRSLEYDEVPLVDHL